MARRRGAEWLPAHERAGARRGAAHGGGTTERGLTVGQAWEQQLDGFFLFFIESVGAVEGTTRLYKSHL